MRVSGRVPRAGGQAPRSATVAGVAIAAALVAGCGSKVAGSGAGGEPPVLHLAAAAQGEATAADAVAPAAAGGKVAASYGAGTYVLQADLPPTPDGAAVYRPDDADKTAVKKLADVLGVTDPVTKTAGGYRAGALFSATNDGRWSYGGGCPIDAPENCAIAYDAGTGTTTSVDSGPVSSGPNTGSGSGTSGSGGTAASGGPGYDPAGKPVPSTGMPASYPGNAGTTVSPPNAPVKPSTVPEPAIEPSPIPVASDETARKAAAPIIAALGLGEPTVEYGNVSADPVIDGLRVVGAMTSISVEADGHISYASGRLLATTKGSSYPLISAKDAYAQLPPRAIPAIGCAEIPGTPIPCPTFPPPVVTDIALGLNLTEDATGPLLVPAWLFTIKDDFEPTAVTAVQPKYIGAPPTPSAGTVEPGTIEPASAIPPVPAQVEPATGAPPLPKDYAPPAPSASESGWFSYGATTGGSSTP